MTSAPTTAPSTGPVAQTYHMHLPGIGGAMFIHRWWCREIHSAGPTTQSVVYDWTGRRFPIDVLQSVERNRREAKNVATQIAKMRRDHPKDRIVISAESGGTGMAVWELEDLPADVHVDAVVLIAPALSPEYDLSAALKHVRGAMHVFVSEQDNLILAWGTEQYGTIDGKHVQAAGRFGFVQPKTADATQYAKLVQVPHQSAWWKYWNFGGHGGGMSPAFAKHVIAPLIARGVLPG
ncbi:MAG: hypothetical protein H7Z14_13975 [Anaerolineae bacterium]|nr:hypothetical protein [Phycisphaerae bacterium]